MGYRQPQMAGYFYPDEKSELLKSIESCFKSSIGPGRLPDEVEKLPELMIKGLISPHAGYIYSGPIAAWGYLRLSQAKKPKTVILVGPNHRAMGPSFAIFPEGIWATPFGEVNIDSEVSSFLMDGLDFLKPDEIAHQYEHSIEVQLPFLQYILGSDFFIVPIIVSSYDIEKLNLLGMRISKLQRDDILFISSSDFSHYISASLAKKMDMEAINYILSGNPSEFLRRVLYGRLSICGAGPISSLLYYVKLEHNVQARLLKYGTSGDITGDFSEVVAYASISFEKILSEVI